MRPEQSLGSVRAGSKEASTQRRLRQGEGARGAARRKLLAV